MNFFATMRTIVLKKVFIILVTITLVELGLYKKNESERRS